MEEASKPQPIMFTAGAVSVMNDKGDVSMQKVKVKRYVAGKRPEWAQDADLDGDSDDEENKFESKMNVDHEHTEVSENSRNRKHAQHMTEKSSSDRRLQRLKERGDDRMDTNERLRQRRNFEPEVISEGEDSEHEEQSKAFRGKVTVVEEESSEDEELEDDEIERRRTLLRQKLQAKRNEEVELYDQLPHTTDLLVKEEEVDKDKSDDEEEYTSESEYTDSEEEGPRLKPVFVRKKDRITIQEREEEEEKQKKLLDQVKKEAEERRKYTLKLVENQVKTEVEEEIKAGNVIQAVDSDDGNDEEEYEAWKLRELRRIKRDREEKEAPQRLKEEVDKLRNMTEEERRAELRSNPKLVTNQLQKGKYKFLQKYYHRGAFYLDNEEDKLKRDITAPTLEDHFDKSILPKVMQVKNFGRSGRTKYTHLLDQDTTSYESPWNQDNALSSKFIAQKAGGMKQVFDRPSRKQRNT